MEKNFGALDHEIVSFEVDRSMLDQRYASPPKMVQLKSGQFIQSLKLDRTQEKLSIISQNDTKVEFRELSAERLKLKQEALKSVLVDQ